MTFATPDGLHAFENPGHEFRPTDDSGRFSTDGTTWDGVTGEAADGRTLDRVPAILTFAFAWQDDHGPDGFFDGSRGRPLPDGSTPKLFSGGTRIHGPTVP